MCSHNLLSDHFRTHVFFGRSPKLRRPFENSEELLMAPACLMRGSHLPGQMRRLVGVVIWIMTYYDI